MITLGLLMLLAAPGAGSVNPAAVALFERDPVLNNWALASHDRNGDGWLTSYEAQGAAEAFKDLADGNRDGRVSVREYEETKAFLIARMGGPAPQIGVAR
jgi:hypothetical protein